MSRNPGIPLDLTWVESAQVDESVIKVQAESLERRDLLNAPSATEYLQLAVSCMDLTSLKGDETSADIHDLCRAAQHPVAGAEIQVAAVCVYDRMVSTALQALQGTAVQVAAVTAGFPQGHASFDVRISDILNSVNRGADEIDVVIDRSLALEGNWTELYDEIVQLRIACGPAKLKLILAAGDLGSLTVVYITALVAMMAGADFIKTSTGREQINATLPIGLVMTSAIRDYKRHTGYKVGLKPAGGIRTTEKALQWVALVQEELGDDWLHPGLFRIGASSLLKDLARELDSRADVQL